MLRYVDLELMLRRRDDDTLAVEARTRLPGSDVEPSRQGLLPIQLNEEGLLAELPDWQAYGRRLTAMVFADGKLRRAFTSALAAAQAGRIPLRLRLNLDANDARLQAITWEALQHPDDERAPFLALHESILLSRLPASDDLTSITLPPHGTLRAVLAVAAPPGLDRYGLAPIDMEGQRDRALAALGSLPTRVIGGQVSPASLDAIIAELRTGAEILYLVCHGSFRDGVPYLWLEAPDGTLAHLPGAAFVEAIAQLQARPLLIVLASCRAAGDGTAETALGAVGPQLAAAGVAAVLAMCDDVGMETAAAFGMAFFTELRRDGQIDRAAAAARRTVRERPDWLAPVLWLRARDGSIWAAPAPPSGLSRRAAVSILIAALIVVGLVGFLAWPRPAAPMPMTGAFNVAVASFGRLDAQGRPQPSPEGAQLATVVYDTLTTELAQLDIRPEVRGPNAIAPLADATAARQLAAAINADIVIFGSINADGLAFTPEIVIAGRQLADAEELAGSYPLGEPMASPVDVGGNMAVRQRFGEELGRRARPLADFVAGVNYYAIKDYAQAANAFRSAEATWGDLGRKELVYLYLANTAGRQGGTDPATLDEAAQAYHQALATRPGYPRARIGLAEVTLLQSIGSCTPETTDEAALSSVITELRDVLAGAAEAEDPNLALKATSTLGRAYLCRTEVASYRGYSQEIQADAAEARVAYAEVTRAYETGNTQMRLRAALAYADIAYLDLTYPADGATDDDDYRQAEAGYTRALQTLRRDRIAGIAGPPSETRLEARYHALLGYIHCRLGERSQAQTDYTTALTLTPDNQSYSDLLAALRERGACRVEE